MRKISAKNFVVFLGLIIASCSAKNDPQTKIRIVDLQGKSHPVATRIPDLNTQVLASQGRLQEEQTVIKNSTTDPKSQLPNPSDNSAFSSQNLSSPQSNPSQVPVATNQAPTQTAQSSNVMIGGGSAQKEQTVEYDLSKPDEAEVAPKKVKFKVGQKAAVSESVAGKTKGFFAQVGSFSTMNSANQTLASMKKFHKGQIEIVDGDKTIYRVLLGPFPNRVKANAMVKKIKTSGHEAILVRNK
ncbi:MAG: SPOR domain-containing protein [Pseudomonadota bacterium]